MKAKVLSRRHHAVGFAIAVSIIMLGAAALASVGVVVPPGSSSGGASVSPTVTISSASSSGNPTPPVSAISVGSSNLAVGPFLPSSGLILASTFVATLVADPTTTQVGGSSNLTIGFSDEVAPVSWTLEENNTVGNLSDVFGGNYTFSPIGSGVYTFYLNATDNASNKASATATVTVEPALVATLVADPTTTQVGESSTLTLGFSGGVAPILWTLERNNTAGNLSDVVGGVYTFTPTISGIYTFYLNSTDAVGSTSSTTAEVTVEPPLLATLGATASAIGLGEQSTLTLGFSGGVMPIIWTLKENGSSTNLSEVTDGHYTFSPAQTGTYTFYLNATDAVGSTSKTTVVITVDGALSAGTISTPYATVGSGEPIVVSTSGASGGTGSGTYTYAWTAVLTGLTGCSTSESTLTYTCMPSGTGTVAVSLTVTDTDSGSADASPSSVTVTVDGALSAGTISTPYATVGSGESIVVSTSGASGGTGSGTYTYAWTAVLTGSTGCSVGESTPTYTCTPTGQGTVAVSLTVTDTDSGSADATPSSVTVTVDAAVSVSPTATVNPTDVGQATTISADADNGTGTYTVYAWSGLPSGCAGPGNVPSFSCTPAPGDNSSSPYTVQVIVTDSDGGTATDTFSLTVTGDPTIGATPAGPLDYDLGQAQGTLRATITYSGPNPTPVEWYNSTDPTCSAASTDTGVEGLILHPSTMSKGTTYYCAVVTDNGVPEYTSASNAVEVVVGATLTAEISTPTSPAVDSGQSITLTANTTGGASPYTNYVWYSTLSSATAGTTCGLSGWVLVLSSELNAYSTASLTSTTYYCYVVTDSTVPTPNTASSPADKVTVDPALSISAEPSSVVIDGGQNVTLSSTVTGGTGSFSWQWYNASGRIVGASGVGATAKYVASSAGRGIYVIFSDSGTAPGATPVATATSSPTASVTVNSAPTITKPLAATVAIDAGQTYTYSVTATGGTGLLSYTWTTSGLTVVSGCTSTSVTCVVSGAAGDYTVSVLLKDQAQGTGGSYPSSSSALTVNAALTAPQVPAISATTLDVNQRLTATGVIPSTGTSSYSWQWLVSINGGTYSPMSQCAVNAGTGASGDAVETCSIVANTLTAGNTYTFELRVTDSASTPESLASSHSLTLTVSLALMAGIPTPTSVSIDSGQSITLKATPSGGSGTYTYRWYSGSTSNTCTALGSPVPEATAATYSASPTTTTYYCYVVTDSATVPETQTSVGSLVVNVNSALTVPSAPTVSATAVNVNQAVSITVTLPSTGTPPYSWQWLVLIGSDPYSNATQCAVNNGTGASAGATETCSIVANTLTAGDTYTFELRVTDGATSPVTQTSAATSAVTVTTPSSSSSLSIWVYVGIGLGLFVILVACLLVLSRRRRPHPGAAPPMQVWQEEPTPPSGVGPAAAAPAYLETPEDIGHVPPGGFTVSPGGTASVATVPPASEAEPDIDVLMTELDRISVDILKRTAKKPKGGRDEEATEEDDTPS